MGSGGGADSSRGPHDRRRYSPAQRRHRRPDARPARHAYPVLFVRFAELPAVWETVREFVRLPGATHCLPIRPRASAWNVLAPEHRHRIDEMYGAFAVALEAHRSAQIV